MLYRLLFAAVFRNMDAERAHRLGFGAIRAVAAVPGATRALRACLGPRDPELRVKALGLEFPGPFGLAAGFDKNAVGIDGLAALGFGVRRGRHGHGASAAGQPRAAAVPAARRPGADQPDGLQQRRRRGGGAAATAVAAEAGEARRVVGAAVMAATRQ